MHLDREYAAYLLAAANIYATQSSTACNQEESQFELRLFKLFEQASEGGVALQDIVVITSTAMAAMLTRAESLPPAKAAPVLKAKMRAVK